VSSYEEAAAVGLGGGTDINSGVVYLDHMINALNEVSGCVMCVCERIYLCFVTNSLTYL